MRLIVIFKIDCSTSKPTNMPSIDPRFDAYIEKAADFARPILTRLRKIIHAACPEVDEVIKWSFPNFEYRGSILCSMAAFKQHCSFGFWLASQMSDPENLFESVGEKSSMGHFGKLTTVSDLPSDDVLIRYIHEAMRLIEKGVKIKKEKPAAPKEPHAPDYFLEALKQNPPASIAYEKFSPSHKKEYIEWITEAKTEATRNKRIASALEMIAVGKSRHWKYVRG